MTLNVERESVCAGDDAHSPHAKRFRLQANGTLSDALSAILVDGYLLTISSARVTWIAVAKDGPVAVLAQQGTEPKFLIDPTTLVADCVTPKAPVGLFFRYWGQADPEVVFERLKSGRRLPSRWSRTPKAK